MNIRKAKNSDKEQILELVKKFYFDAPQMIKNWERNFSGLMPLTFVCEEDSVLLAYITYADGSFIGEKDSLYIGDLFVLEQARGKGIATKLVEEVEKVRKSLGKEHLMLDNRKEDLAANKLYEKLGFKFYKNKNKDSVRLRR